MPYFQPSSIYLKELILSILPISIFFFVFCLIAKGIDRRQILKIGIGLLYTYFGLVIFLIGVNVGFMPAGNYLGQKLASDEFQFILVPVAMLIGYFIVRAEPAIYVLMKQVEEITDGNISGNSLKHTLSIGVAVSCGLSMLRVLLNIPILYFIIPGYALAILLSFISPKIFTAIAFDSGGVASGPMTAAFLLPFAIGACDSVGGNVLTCGFGTVAMVAMTPIIAIQVFGAYYALKQKYRIDPVENNNSEEFELNSVIEF